MQRTAAEMGRARRYETQLAPLLALSPRSVRLEGPISRRPTPTINSLAAAAVEEGRFDVGMLQHQLDRLPDLRREVGRLDFRRRRKVLEDEVVGNARQEVVLGWQPPDPEAGDDDEAALVVVETEQSAQSVFVVVVLPERR